MSDEVGGKHREDPIGSTGPRGKSLEQRKHKLDGPSWTPTERVIKDRLMRQFMKTGEGAGGNSSLWRQSEVWCLACGNYPKAGDGSTHLCVRCQAKSDTHEAAR